MELIWKNLLHANFRCGRMLYSRADSMAGRGSAPSA